MSRRQYSSLIYLSPRDVRKNRSDPVHSMLTCAAFARLGLDVTLVAPGVAPGEGASTGGVEDVFALFKLEPTFKIHELQTHLRESQNGVRPFRRAAKQLVEGTRFFWNRRQQLQDDSVVVYSKCYVLPLPFLVFRALGLVRGTFLIEASSVKALPHHRWLFRRADMIVAGLTSTVTRIMEVSGVPRERITPTPLRFQSEDGITGTPESKDACRAALGFAQDRRYVMYAGKTGRRHPSLEYFLDAAERLPQYEFVVVGINEQAIGYYGKALEKPNLHLRPFLPLSDFERYVKAADVLVDYYARTPFNDEYLGPGKSKSYFASGNPVIFARLRSLQELFPEDCVHFVDPDQPALLAEAIRYLMDHPEIAARKAERAQVFARENSYSRTLSRVLDSVVAAER